MAVAPQPQVKNPALAAILSFLIPGLGQIYNGEVVKGLIIIGVQIINILLATIVIGIFTGLIVFVWAIYDAYKTAEKINAQAGQQALVNTKVCPRCAERVNSGAKVCHHCGYEFMPDQPLLTTTGTPALPIASEPAPAVAVAVPVAIATKPCPNCGNEVKVDAKFCQHCGYQFETPAPAGTGQAPASEDMG